MSISEYYKILENCNGKKIAIIGDLMLDRYVWGNVSRVSPEAPVPVIDVLRESDSLGGASNVANNIKSLGGVPILFGVVGKDNNGNVLKSILEKNSFDVSGIIVDETRPTTVKLRVIAHQQHVVRIDNEKRESINSEIEKKLLTALENNIYNIDGIILEDYNKGVITQNILQNVIALATKHNKIITVDPKHSHFFNYKNVTLFKPNIKEMEEAFGRKIFDHEELIEIGKELMHKIHAQNILLTQGEKGMILIQSHGGVHNIPTRALHIADVSGAGDTVIATSTLAMTAGASILQAAILANHAAGVVCGEVGAVPISKSALKNSLQNDSL
ncbi:MAG: D-glycero-beta-D-manno-heptose-7-phosphate kinase [Bacteroidetes bacterium]|nr:D-glycero-beta-D-manno-heptose-7-phosphate kinase [Bacteroidota bacterium]